MKRMKQITLSFLLVFSMLFALAIPQTNAQAAVKSYITEKNFKGLYYPQGNSADSTFELRINSISKGTVTFEVDRTNPSNATSTDVVKAKIKGDTARFKFVDIMDLPGYGTIQFKKNKEVIVSLTNNMNFTMDKVHFKKQDNRNTVYMVMASQVSRFEKRNNKLNIKYKYGISSCAYSTVKNMQISDYESYFFEGNKSSMSFTIGSKCKWVNLDFFDTLSAPSIGSVSYNSIKKDIKNFSGDDYPIFIYTKGTTVYKVAVSYP